MIKYIRCKGKFLVFLKKFLMILNMNIFKYSVFPGPSCLYIQQDLHPEDHLVYKKRYKIVFIFLYNEVM